MYPNGAHAGPRRATCRDDDLPGGRRTLGDHERIAIQGTFNTTTGEGTFTVLPDARALERDLGTSPATATSSRPREEDGQSVTVIVGQDNLTGKHGTFTVSQQIDSIQVGGDYWTDKGRDRSRLAPVRTQACAADRVRGRRAPEAAAPLQGRRLRREQLKTQRGRLSGRPSHSVLVRIARTNLSRGGRHLGRDDPGTQARLRVSRTVTTSPWRSSSNRS